MRWCGPGHVSGFSRSGPAAPPQHRCGPGVPARSFVTTLSGIASASRQHHLRVRILALFLPSGFRQVPPRRTGLEFVERRWTEPMRPACSDAGCPASCCSIIPMVCSSWPALPRQGPVSPQHRRKGSSSCRLFPMPRGLYVKARDLPGAGHGICLALGSGDLMLQAENGPQAACGFLRGNHRQAHQSTRMGGLHGQDEVVQAPRFWRRPARPSLSSIADLQPDPPPILEPVLARKTAQPAGKQGFSL